MEINVCQVRLGGSCLLLKLVEGIIFLSPLGLEYWRFMDAFCLVFDLTERQDSFRARGMVVPYLLVFCSFELIRCRCGGPGSRVQCPRGLEIQQANFSDPRRHRLQYILLTKKWNIQQMGWHSGRIYSLHLSGRGSLNSADITGVLDGYALKMLKPESQQIPLTS